LVEIPDQDIHIGQVMAEMGELEDANGGEFLFHVLLLDWDFADAIGLYDIRAVSQSGEGEFEKWKRPEVVR
jgi:hypothetical protein